jgi:hypothetical protein
LQAKGKKHNIHGQDELLRNLQTEKIDDASGLLRKLKQVTGMKLQVFITDGLGSYAEAYQKEFCKGETRTLDTSLAR